MKTSQIKTRAPFNELFPIDPSVLSAIKARIAAHGYDESQPIVIWDEEGVVVDGHSRLQAAMGLSLEEVPVHRRSFPDEDAALEYGIHNQRHRRNLTEVEILRCIEAVDKRRDRGGDRRSEEAKSKPPIGGIEKSKSPSAQDTARIVGVSTRKVERARAVLAEPQAAAEVKAGKKKISRAYQEIQANRKSQNQPEPAENQEDERQAILKKALNEIHHWQEKYEGYSELSAIFMAIDSCNLNLEQMEMLPKAEESPTPGELGGPCPPSLSCEPEGEEQHLSNMENDDPDNHCPVPASTAESNPSPSEMSDPEANDLATPESCLSVIDEHDPVQCGDCQHFAASSGAPSGRGHCCLGEKSRNGQSTQFAGDKHRCSFFLPKGSIKNLAVLG
jgi:ParB family chromosome partitioning protein